MELEDPQLLGVDPVPRPITEQLRSDPFQLAEDPEHFQEWFITTFRDYTAVYKTEWALLCDLQVGVLGDTLHISCLPEKLAKARKTYRKQVGGGGSRLPRR